MTRMLLSLFVLALLGGCQTPPPPQVEQPRQKPVIIKPGAEQWLENRLALCLLPSDEQRVRLSELAANAVHADRAAKFERVLLATCQPDFTPGLLREALNDIGDIDKWSPAEQALINLVSDLSRSYRILEEKNQKLADQLEATIRGIRAIETELDGIETNGVSP